MVTDSKDAIRCPERGGMMRRAASATATRSDSIFPLELDNYSDPQPCLCRILIPGLLADFFPQKKAYSSLCPHLLADTFTNAQLFQDHISTGSNPCISAIAGTLSLSYNTIQGGPCSTTPCPAFLFPLGPVSKRDQTPLFWDKPPK